MRFPDFPAGAKAAAAFLVVVLLIVGIVAALSGGDGGSSGSADKAEAGSQVEPAPRLSDPSQQAEAFSQWLREQGR